MLPVNARLIYESLEQEKKPIYSTGDYETVVKIIEEQEIVSLNVFQ